jgi:hypothetical protein
VTTDPAALLTGPRGRRLCLESVGAPTGDASAPVHDAFRLAVMMSAHDLDPGRGSSRVMLGGFTDGRQEASAAHTPADVVRLLGTLPLPACDEVHLLEALRAAVDSARYWQEPDGEDVLAALPEVRDALAPVAARLTSCAAADWWWAPLDRSEQWTVTYADPSPAPPVTGTAAERLAHWRVRAIEEEVRAQAERPRDPRAAWSGSWWSMPQAGLVHSTRGVGRLGPVGLWLVEDSFGWDRATVRPLIVPSDATVYEIDGPQAWAELCRRYPLGVTASRRHDWYRATGIDARWVIPDWSRVAQDVDGVHLTVAGYLTTAGRAVEVGDGTLTVLAGWDPGATYWLTDDVRAGADGQEWVRADDGVWREQPGSASLPVSGTTH